jgi:competence ComEA-like helix-hairpin-helix protein
MSLLALSLFALAAWPRGETAPETLSPCARPAALLEATGERRLLCLDRDTALRQVSGACQTRDVPTGAEVALESDGTCRVAPGGMPGRMRLLSGERLDLNRASAEDLEALPGIGPSLAERIIATRRELGRFDSVEDLLEVSGIGEMRLSKLAPFFFVAPAIPQRPERSPSGGD